MNLYWVTTPCHLEDWFVVAETKKKAEEFHEHAEGFDLSYARAKLVCRIPASLNKEHGKIPQDDLGYWPSMELLEKLGGTIISRDAPRILNIEGEIYIEGRSVEGIIIGLASQNSGVYVLQEQNENKFKIGHSSKLESRIKQLNTANPDNLKFVFYIETPHYKSLEAHLHEVYKDHKIRGEWFRFDAEVKEDLRQRLLFLTSKSREFHFVDVEEIRKWGRC